MSKNLLVIELHFRWALSTRKLMVAFIALLLNLFTLFTGEIKSSEIVDPDTHYLLLNDVASF